MATGRLRACERGALDHPVIIDRKSSGIMERPPIIPKYEIVLGPRMIEAKLGLYRMGHHLFEEIVRFVFGKAEDRQIAERA